MHGSESSRPAARYQADRALFLLLLSAPYQSIRLAARAKAVSKVTLGLFGPLRDHGRSAKSS